MEQPPYSSLSLTYLLTTKKIKKETIGGEEMYFLKFPNNKKVKLQQSSELCRLSNPALGDFSISWSLIPETKSGGGGAGWEKRRHGKGRGVAEEEDEHDNDVDDEKQAADDQVDDDADGDEPYDDDMEPPAESCHQGAARQHQYYYSLEYIGKDGQIWRETYADGIPCPT